MATAEQIQKARATKSKPPVTQRTKFRKFKGFNPKQRAMILEAEGKIDGTLEGAKALAKAANTAQGIINQKYNGGMIRGFAEGDLVDMGKYWGVEQADGTPLNLGTKSKTRAEAKAESVLAISDAIEAGGAIDQRTPGAPKYDLVDIGKTWAIQTVNADGTKGALLDTGYTKKANVTGMLDNLSAKPTEVIDPVDPVDPVVEEEAPVNALDYTDAILTGEQGLNPNATAQAIDITDDQVAAGNVDPSVGNVGIDTTPTVAATVAPTAVATIPTAQDAVQIEDPTLTQEAIDAAAQVDETKGVIDAQSTIDAQTMDASDLSALDVEAAQIADEDITQVEAVDPRVEQTGEMISKYDADASTAAEFAEEVQAAQGEVSTLSTVKGQLAELQKEFDNNEIPMWASGAYRQAQQGLAARGLSGSSMAGQALVQAFMEASLPIAQADARVYQEMDMANLSNRQQRAMLAAQQRATFIGQEFDQAFQMRVMNAAKVSDIANMNFSAEQQVALENARLTQTVNLANLSNRQAKIMADAASMTQIEMINLNNRQQAAVANAQAFLQMDMTNLAFDQQSAMFEAQSRVQSLFTDAAAENAAKNINAQSSNDMNKFFAGLINNTDIQNASSINGMAQFNTDAVNSIAQFNSQMINQRELWNAENARVIAESNANWRRAVTTTNNATQNAVNQMNAQNSFGLQTQAYANLWQRDRDIMNMAFQTATTKDQQAHEIMLAKMGQQAEKAGALGTLVGATINAFAGSESFWEWMGVS